MLGRVTVNGLVRSAVNREVRLLVADDIEPFDPNALFDGKFKDASKDSPDFSWDFARQADIDGNDSQTLPKGAMKGSKAHEPSVRRMTTRRRALPRTIKAVVRQKISEGDSDVNRLAVGVVTGPSRSRTFAMDTRGFR